MTVAGWPADAGDYLLTVARGAIAERLKVADPGPAIRALWDRRGTPGWAMDLAATFVTLTLSESLRGCIGTVLAYRPLVEDLHCNAQAAAFRDPRFPPVTLREYERLRVEVSLLSASETLPVTSEADALAHLRPGVDGVILTAGRHRGTFLPQVWDELPEPADFWAHLKRKAGLPATYWGDDVRVERYTVTAFREPPPPLTARSQGVSEV